MLVDSYQNYQFESQPPSKSLFKKKKNFIRIEKSGLNSFSGSPSSQFGDFEPHLLQSSKKKKERERDRIF